MANAFSPSSLDIRQFAQQHAQLAQRSALAAFPRLWMGIDSQDGAQENQEQGMVDWVAEGLWRDAQGRELMDDTTAAKLMAQPWLRLQIRARAPCICQRCLGIMWVSIEEDRLFRFLPDEESAAAEDEISDEVVLVSSREFNLLELVEEELLLSLPLIPTHEQCPELPAGLRATDAQVADQDTESKSAALDTKQPFADLAEMMRQKNK